MMNYGCEGLNVVISGGTSGIGLAAAEKFLRDGANVYLLGRSVLRGAMAVQKLLAITERSAFYIPCILRQRHCGHYIEDRRDTV